MTPPWNFPLAIGLGGTLAALVAGNAVLVKPSPETPLVLARALELCWKPAFPEDALGLVLADDDAAEPLVTDPRVERRGSHRRHGDRAPVPPPATRASISWPKRAART